MKHKAPSVRPARFPLTIGTPYGVVELELTPCENCSDHFDFRITSSAPALSTRAAEPFLFRLMNTLGIIAAELWMELPPKAVRRSIELGTYNNDELVIPFSELN
jgi:hypothetical protein